MAHESDRFEGQQSRPRAGRLNNAARTTRRRFLKMAGGTIAVVTASAGSIVGFAPEASAQVDCYTLWEQCRGRADSQAERDCCTACYIRCQGGKQETPCRRFVDCGGSW